MSAGIHYFANHTPVGILGLSQVYAMLRGRAFYAAAGKVVPAYRQRQASIRIFNPQKKHSPLHMKDFYAWFSEDSSVKALISKCSPPLWRFCRFSADFQWLSGVKAWYFNPSQAFTERCECFVNALWMLSCPCEHFEFKAFTLESVGNQKKTSIVWMGEYFFGK